MEPIIEIVNFKLVDGAKEADFLAAAKQSQAFVEQLAGFLYRSLSVNENNGTWTDTVYWKTIMDAKVAAEAFWEHNECQAFMAFIEHKSVDMQHQSIKMDSGCTTS